MPRQLGWPQRSVHKPCTVPPAREIVQYTLSSATARGPRMLHCSTRTSKHGLRHHRADSFAFRLHPVAIVFRRLWLSLSNPCGYRIQMPLAIVGMSTDGKIHDLNDTLQSKYRAAESNHDTAAEAAAFATSKYNFYTSAKAISTKSWESTKPKLLIEVGWQVGRDGWHL